MNVWEKVMEALQKNPSAQDNRNSFSIEEEFILKYGSVERCRKLARKNGWKTSKVGPDIYFTN